MFDCLHDMGDPVGAARRIRESLADDGTLLLVEPAAGERLEDNLNPVGRLYYGLSTVICTPSSLAQEVGLGLGAQAGPQRLEEVLHEAGFSHVRVATQTPFNLIIEARAIGAGTERGELLLAALAVVARPASPGCAPTGSGHPGAAGREAAAARSARPAVAAPRARPSRAEHDGLGDRVADGQRPGPSNRSRAVGHAGRATAASAQAEAYQARHMPL